MSNMRSTKSDQPALQYNVQPTSTGALTHIHVTHVSNALTDFSSLDVGVLVQVPALTVPPPTVATCRTSPGAPVAARDPVRSAADVTPVGPSLGVAATALRIHTHAHAAGKEHMVAGGDQGRAPIVERGNIIQVKGLRTQTAAPHVVRGSTTPTSDQTQRQPVPHAT